MPFRKPSVTSIDVARLAGVSQSAVSRAFTPGTSVSAATRDRVLEAAQSLNYVPNSFARSLITRRSNIVAMVVGNMQNPFYVDLLDRVTCALQRRGAQVLVFRVDNDSEVDEALIPVLQYQVDGIAISSAHVSPKMADLCAARAIPVVMINRSAPNLPVRSIGCDNLLGARTAARALFEAGGQRFALMTGAPNAPGVEDRRKGFQQQLAEFGVDPTSIRIDCGHYSYTGGFSAALRLFGEAEDRPDALFCQNDIMAIGAIDALRECLCLRIPDDVMVFGFDDIPEASRPSYRLTTIRQPLEDMVSRIVAQFDLNDEESDSEPGPAELLVPGRLVQRETLRAASENLPG